MSSQATSTDKAASNSTRVLTEEQAQDLRRCVEILDPVVQSLVADALKADTASLDAISHNLQCALDQVRKIFPRVSCGMRHPTDHDERLLSIETILTYVEFKFNARNAPRPEIHQRLFPIAMETLGYLRQVKSECDYEEYNRLNPIQEFASGPVFSEAVTKELEEYPDFTGIGMM